MNSHIEQFPQIRFEDLSAVNKFIAILCQLEDKLPFYKILEIANINPTQLTVEDWESIYNFLVGGNINRTDLLTAEERVLARLNQPTWVGNDAYRDLIPGEEVNVVEDRRKSEEVKRVLLIQVPIYTDLAESIVEGNYQLKNLVDKKLLLEQTGASLLEVESLIVRHFIGSWGEI